MRPAYRIDRKEEVVHSYATHSYLLKGEKPIAIPLSPCFTKCVDFENARNRYYRVSTLKELFETVEITKTFSYLKAISLYTKVKR